MDEETKKWVIRQARTNNFFISDVKFSRASVFITIPDDDDIAQDMQQSLLKSMGGRLCPNHIRNRTNCTVLWYIEGDKVLDLFKQILKFLPPYKRYLAQFWIDNDGVNPDSAWAANGQDH